MENGESVQATIGNNISNNTGDMRHLIYERRENLMERAIAGGERNEV
jgi:hypothetical protein